VVQKAWVLEVRKRFGSSGGSGGAKLLRSEIQVDALISIIESIRKKLFIWRYRVSSLIGADSAKVNVAFR
jgi:hypothetical protein